MNEFTKEELIYMRDGIVLITEKCNISKQMLNNLSNTECKIQSMIDNHCEHEWVNGTYCEKCGRSSAL